MGYANYINNLSPDYWQTLEGQAFFKAFGDVGDELINDALLVVYYLNKKDLFQEMLF